MTNELDRRDFVIATGVAALSSGIASGTATASESGASSSDLSQTVTAGSSEYDEYIENGDGHIVDPSRAGQPTADEVERTSDVITQQAGDDTQVAVTVAPPGRSYPTDGTIDIWMGVYDDSGTIEAGLEDESLTIFVERPDGTEETFDAVTDENGSAHLEYDLSEAGRDDGTYSVSVEHDESDASTLVNVPVGTWIDLTTRTFDAVHVGTEVTFAFLARNGESPDSGVELEMSVENPEGDIISERTAETDENGFTTITFTPEQTGIYSIEGEQTDGELSDSGHVTAAEVTGGHNLDIRHGLAGGESVYGGYLRDADGMVADTDFVLRFVDEKWDDDDEIILEEDVTTDENGYFLIEYELPSEIQDDLEIEAELTDGTEIELTVDSIRVNQLPEDDPDEEDVSFDASISEWQAAPGQDVQIEIEADEAGEPITDADVDLFLRYDHSGPPALSTTLTTDEEGTASKTFSIPENAPDGTWSSGGAVLHHDGETYTSSLSMSIEAYEIWFDPTTIPGEESEFSITVTDTETEDPVEGVPLIFDAHYGTDSAGSFDTGSLVSGADGEDTTTVTVPDDVRFNEYANYISRYRSTNTYRWLEPEHPGSLSYSESVAAGETIDLEFETDADSTATGIAFGRTSSPQVTVGTQMSSDESSSLTIPDHAAGGSFQLRVWATDENGRHYNDTAWISVEDEPETTAVFDVTPETPEVGEVVTFDGSNSTAATGSLTYEWNFGDGSSAEGAVVEHTYEEASEYEVTLTVTDDDGNSDTATDTVSVEDDDPDEDPTLEDYADEEGIVQPPGVLEAIDDWRDDKIDTPFVLDVIDAWRDGEPVV